MSIYIPNVDEISQSTAELLLLPVSEKGRSLCLNSTSGFDFEFLISSSAWQIASATVNVT